MGIRTANQNELLRVEKFYHSLIDDMKDFEIKPGWEKGIYPTTDFLEKSIANDEMYIFSKNIA